MGPFVSLQPGTDEIIQSIGAGIMVGMKYNDEKDDIRSWNLGVGIAVDPNTKVLGDGIEQNKPLPAGESSVRLKETTQVGVLVLLSFGFL